MKNLNFVFLPLLSLLMLATACQSNEQKKAEVIEAESPTEQPAMDEAAIAKYQAAVVIEDIPNQSYVGIREVVKMTDMGTFFEKAYGQLGANLGANIAGSPAGLYYSWEPEKGESDMVAAFPVSKAMSATEAMVSVELGGKAAVINYMGASEGSISAHFGMDAYFKDKGLKIKSPVLEQYVVGAESGKPVEEHLTRIIYFIEE